MNTKIQGLLVRSGRLEEQAQDMREAVEDAERNAVAFRVLAAREAVVGPQRRDAAAAAVAAQRARETELQARYKELRSQLDELRSGAAQAAAGAVAV